MSNSTSSAGPKKSSYKAILQRPSSMKPETTVDSKRAPLAVMAKAAEVALPVPLLVREPSAEVHDWNWACRQHGVRFAPRGSKDYERVMETYRDANPVVAGSSESLSDEQKARRELWKQCSSELGIKFCAKGSDDYHRIMEIYAPRLDELFPLTPVYTL